MKILSLIALLFAATFVGTATSHAQTFDWIVSDVDVYELRVLRTGRDRMTAQIDGIGRRSFSVPPSFRFYIEGKQYRLRDLQPGQRLTAYVTRNAKGNLQLVDAGPVQATPPAQPMSTPIVAPPAPLPEELAMLPKTGSVLPITLGIALGAAIMAIVIRARRRRIIV